MISTVWGAVERRGQRCEDFYSYSFISRPLDSLAGLVRFWICWKTSLMSRRDTKSNSTRLPPRSVARKPLGKQTKAGRRKMLEKETADREQINEKIASCTDKLLIGVLSDGGVSADQLGGLREGLLQKDDDDTKTSLVQADSCAAKAWSLASCYPSIDINELVLILHELRSLLCDKAALESKTPSRMLDDIRGDPKADPAALEIAEQNFASIADVVSRCNIGAYKTRALHQIVSEKSEVGSAA